MRRSTKALTAAVLGAAAAVSMASAQQLPAPDHQPQAQSLPAGSATPESPSGSEYSQLHGMTSARGARQLLRNGLDYLKYQQYERALKYLREAEVRQKELNSSEKLALKQGIENAQRGLRKAADEDAAYAISDRSRPGNGFVAAKPEARIAAVGDQLRRPARRPGASALAATGMLGNDGEDRGDPIRLTSAEAAIDDRTAAASTAGTRLADAENVGPADQDVPRSMPEIPQIPRVSRLPDLTRTGEPEPALASDSRPVAPPHSSAFEFRCSDTSRRRASRAPRRSRHSGTNPDVTNQRARVCRRC